MPSHSVAAGIGLNYIISDIFFLAGNIFLLYDIQSEMHFAFNLIGRDATNSITESQSMKKTIEFKLWGVNAEPSIGAKISPSLIATLGARVQWIQYTSQQTETNMLLSKGDKLNDYLFGIFVGVMYLL